jgi:head-tail adaptor
MNQFIEIIKSSLTKDSEGFAKIEDITLAKIRAYKEEQHGSIFWANRATFSKATCLFRFRVIPDVEIKVNNTVICKGEKYKILSVEDVKGRGMYIEILCEEVHPS